MIPTNPLTSIYDTSKCKDYLDCPRKFFFTHIVGWKPTYPNNHLVFGEAWHRAMAFMLQTGYSADNILYAFNEKFLPYYRSIFPASTDELFGAKTPETALVALAEYAQEYSEDLKKFSVLHVEVSGAVPIDEIDVIHFRIDAIVEDNSDGKIYALEHKTTSNLSRFWTDQWDLDLQPATYTHALRAAYPDKIVKGTKVSGTMFKVLKQTGPKIEFSRIPVWKNNDQMRNWLFTINSIISEIKWNIEQLSHCSDSDDILPCFRMNPNNCTKYFGCEFHDFCGAWPNPLRKLDPVPDGFEVKFWDPRELESQYQLTFEEKQNE